MRTDSTVSLLHGEEVQAYKTLRPSKRQFPNRETTCCWQKLFALGRAPSSANNSLWRQFFDNCFTTVAALQILQRSGSCRRSRTSFHRLRSCPFPPVSGSFNSFNPLSGNSLLSSRTTVAARPGRTPARFRRPSTHTPLLRPSHRHARSSNPRIHFHLAEIPPERYRARVSLYDHNQAIPCPPPMHAVAKYSANSFGDSFNTVISNRVPKRQGIRSAIFRYVGLVAIGPSSFHRQIREAKASFTSTRSICSSFNPKLRRRATKDGTNCDAGVHAGDTHDTILPTGFQPRSFAILSFVHNRCRTIHYRWHSLR